MSLVTALPIPATAPMTDFASSDADSCPIERTTERDTRGSRDIENTCADDNRLPTGGTAEFQRDEFPFGSVGTGR